MTELENVLVALKHIRVHSIAVEYQLQEEIARTLDHFSIQYVKEYRLGPRNRVDFLTTGGVAIEVKKGKPNRAGLYSQVKRYAAFEAVTAIVAVVETGLTNPLPDSINGKPCYLFPLQKLWGIAL